MSARPVEPGERFGRLVVLTGDVTRLPGWHQIVMCRCDCGTEKLVRVALLRNGDTRSCGCLRRELAKGNLNGPALLKWACSQANTTRLRKINTTHGLTRHPLYGTWKGMLNRCENPKNRAYRSYGGRGIKVCGRWHDLAIFITDIEREIGPKPEGRQPSGRPLYTIDRIGNDGNYEPGNVRWATASEQQRNKRARQVQQIIRAPQNGHASPEGDMSR